MILPRRATVLFCGLIAAGGMGLASEPRPGTAGGGSLPSIPEVRPVNGVTSLTLTAAETPAGRAGLRFDGAPVPPTIRVRPGDRIKIAYVNHLAAHSKEKCALGPCTGITNLHFHGMQVSPRAPQDDILTMLASPGQTLHYDVRVPAHHVPGLYWFHTHPHGESAEQDLDGMSGAIVVEGIDRYAPAVRGLRERILVVRTMNAEHADPQRIQSLRTLLNIPAKDCGTSGEEIAGVATVNNALRPAIAVAPGERQFWRIVNAQPESFLDIAVDGEPMEVVALDAEPLGYRNPARPSMRVRHLLVPPAGRVEAIVTGPPAGAHATLRSACVNTGKSGDINQGQVLADIVPATSSDAPMQTVPVSSGPPAHKSVAGVAAAEHAKPKFTVKFTEGNHAFYINKQKFSMDAKPMTTVHIGSYQHWRIVNDADEMHPFHIHQVHFLTYAEDGRTVTSPVWLDTVNVRGKSTIDVVADFTDPIIRGISVFHCHILNHEDKGMMAKVVFASGNTAGLPDIGPVPALNLRDAVSGAPLLPQLKRKHVLVSFIASTCTDKCALTEGTFVRVQQLLKKAGRLGSGTALVLVTVDPVTDTPAKLRRLAQATGAIPSAFHFATGSPAEVGRVLEGYGVTLAFRNGTRNDPAHSSPTYLVDEAWHARSLFSFSDSPSAIASAALRL